MKLRIIFLNCTRTKEEKAHRELVFRDAMLEYCPSIEKLAEWQERRHYEYARAYWKGKFAVGQILTKYERDHSIFKAEFSIK